MKKIENLYVPPEERLLIIDLTNYKFLDKELFLEFINNILAMNKNIIRCNFEIRFNDETIEDEISKLKRLKLKDNTIFLF